MENIKYPDNYEKWPIMWKFCFEDGVKAGRASAQNIDYAKCKEALRLMYEAAMCAERCDELYDNFDYDVLDMAKEALK